MESPIFLPFCANVTSTRKQEIPAIKAFHNGLLL